MHHFRKNKLKSIKIITIYMVLILAFLVFFIRCTDKKTTSGNIQYIFRKDNVIPWSIVSFDVKERTPNQRIEMLEELGFNQYAYGNRPKHQSTMKQELLLAKEKNIKISAVWMYINLNKDRTNNLKPHSEAIFKVLEEVGLQTQIWIGVNPNYFENLNDNDALKQTVKIIEYLSKRANAIGCKIALYNHGGWFGNVTNQLRIIQSIPNQEIGVIYNFHHAHDDLDNFESNIKEILPYLWCVNLNGMRKEGPKIMQIGSGDLEKNMIQQILNLGYEGPFGILGHVKGGDSKVILQNNYIGLKKLYPAND